jgi:hypothetical protein
MDNQQLHTLVKDTENKIKEFEAVLVGIIGDDDPRKVIGLTDTFIRLTFQDIYTMIRNVKHNID